MFRRFALLALVISLAIPSAADAFFFRHWHYGPPVVYAYPAPMVYAVPMYSFPPVMSYPVFPVYECPNVVAQPEQAKPQPKPIDQPVPKAMEQPKPQVETPKVEAPKPMAIKPAAAEGKPKNDLAIPSPAVPEKPVEQPKPKPLEIAPLPLVVPPQKDPMDKKEATVPVPPKLNLPLANPEPAVPGKDEKKIPEIKLPPLVSESKYTPVEQQKIQIVPVAGRRAGEKMTVNVYNYADRELTFEFDGKTSKLPAKSSLGIEVPESFSWKLGRESHTTTIPSDAAGLCVIIK